MYWERGPEVFGEVRIGLPRFDYALGCFIWAFHFLFGFWAFNWAINFYLGPWLISNLQISNNLWSTKELIKICKRRYETKNCCKFVNKIFLYDFLNVLKFVNKIFLSVNFASNLIKVSGCSMFYLIIKNLTNYSIYYNIL